MPNLLRRLMSAYCMRGNHADCNQPPNGKGEGCQCRCHLRCQHCKARQHSKCSGTTYSMAKCKCTCRRGKR